MQNEGNGFGLHAAAILNCVAKFIKNVGIGKRNKCVTGKNFGYSLTLASDTTAQVSGVGIGGTKAEWRLKSQSTIVM